SEHGRWPGLLATRREIRVIEERDVASRDHAERDPHREVVEEEALVTAPQREEGKADGLERRAQQQCLLPSPQVREQTCRDFAAHCGSKAGDLAGISMYRVRVGRTSSSQRPSMKSSTGSIVQVESAVAMSASSGNLDIRISAAPRASTGRSASGGPRGRALRR